jgi:uncharacterized protein with FMN-binding domain
MNNKKVLISIGAVVIVAAGVYGVAAMSKQSSAPAEIMPTTDTTSGTSSAVTTPVADTPTKTTTSGQVSASTYKDGTYTATGSYRSPGGPDQIKITVALKNDIITSVSAVPMPGDRESTKYQNLFVSGYQSVVVGKDISTLKLGAVSGSSLTPIGFNDAITQIKAQAKA